MPRILMVLLLAFALVAAHAAERGKSRKRVAARQAPPVAAAAAAAAALPYGASSESPVFVRVVANEPSAEERARLAEERNERNSMDNRVLKETRRIAESTSGLSLAAFALLALTAAGLGVAVLQSRQLRRATGAAEAAAEAAQQSAQQAEQAAQRQLRAYVLLLRAVPEIRGQEFIVTFIFRNYGQTPAYNVRSAAQLAIWKADEPFQPAEITPAQTQGAGSVIGPGGHLDSSNRLARPAPWEYTLKQELEAGLTQGHVYGKVFYTDAFDNERVTTFQLLLGKDNNGKWVLATAASGNAAT